MDNHKEILEACKREEQAYWNMRDDLLRRFNGKWVVVSGGKVVAQGNNPLRAVAEASEKGVKFSYLTRVGFEQNAFQIRRIRFPYDVSYDIPIPKASAVVHNVKHSAKKELSDLIVDTGADVTCLHDEDVTGAKLAEGGIFLSKTQSYGAAPQPALMYKGLIEIDKKFYQALVRPVDSANERLLGRDVLNQLTVTLNGKGGETIFK